MALGLTVAAGAWAQPALPSQDPFYTTYPGPLANYAPGTVLASRSVSISEAGLPVTVPVSATQVLYRTTGEGGQPTATVATVIRPLTPSPNEAKLVSYQTFYDALGSECDPSYTLQGGNPSYSTAQADEQFMLSYVQAGYSVVVSDYEGEDLEWGAGQEAGYGTLDGIRAAENFLSLPSSTPAAMVGYSGGSIATEYAAEEAPTYASELNIVGAAAGGVPVDYAHNLTYVNGSSDWSGVIPAVLVGLGRAFGIDFSPYLSAYGQQVTSQVQDECINDFVGSYPGLTIQKMLQPLYQDYYADPLMVSILNDEIMSDTGTPRIPMFLAVGNSDGTGDGVMVTKDVQGLAYTYCQRGLTIKYSEYDGDDHTEAAVPFEATALTYLTGLLAGGSAENDCASIGPGNSLAPLPYPGGKTLSPGAPPASASASAAAAQIRLNFRDLGRKPRKDGVVIELWTSSGTLRGLVVRMRQGKRVVDTLKSVRVTTSGHELVLRIHGKMPSPGRYTITVWSGGRVLFRRTIPVH